MFAVSSARSRRLSLSFVALLALASCKETVANLEPVGSINIDNKNIILSPGGTTSVAYTLLSRTGAPLSTDGRTVQFNSSNSAVATVNNTGLITGVANGNAIVTVSSGGQSATASVAVQSAVDRVIVAPPSTTLQVGATQALTVSLLAADGTPLSGRTILYQTSNASVATVNATGVILAIAPGTATITTSAEGKSAPTAVTVTQVGVSTIDVQPVGPVILRVGTTKQFTATPKAANGDPLTRTVTWSSVATDVATVSSTGLVTAVNPGSTAINADAEGKRATVQVVVTLQPVEKVTVNGTSPVTVGQPAQFSVTLRDSADRVLSNVGRQVFWESLNIPVAGVTAQGVVSGVTPGSAIIQATVEGKTGQFTVQIVNAPVASVVVGPASTINVGEQLQLIVQARDINSQTLSLVGRTINWSSSNAGVATVSGSGLVVGAASGTTTITVTVDGVPGTTNITVR